MKNKNEALWASVEHWLDNWNTLHQGGELTIHNISGPECPLCQFCTVVVRGCNLVRCSSCPVYDLTGEFDCDNTPWERVANTISSYHAGVASEYELLEAVEDEYCFLVELALERGATCDA